MCGDGSGAAPSWPSRSRSSRVDLFVAGLGQNPAIPIDHATQPTTPALRFLQAHRTERFTALKPVTPSALVLPLPPNVAMRYGVQDARGYVLPTEKRYSALWRESIATSRGCYYFFCVVLADSRPQARRALGVLGVRYLLQDPRDPPLQGLRLAYSGSDARIYENPDAVPKAYLVDHQLRGPPRPGRRGRPGVARLPPAAPCSRTTRSPPSPAARARDPPGPRG